MHPGAHTTFLIIAGLLVFLAVSIFGLSHTLGMRVDNDGSMEGCVFTGKIMLCKMNVLEHVALWRTMFATTFQKVFLLAALVVTVFVLVLWRDVQRLAHMRRTIIGRLYLRRHRDIFLFDPLRSAFSRGILHPKIYDPIVL